MDQHPVVFCCPVRTAIGSYGGSLKGIAAPALGAAAIAESLRRSGLPAAAVQAVIMGNVIQAGLGMNPARQAGIGAGLPVTVPAMTLNRVCGSGAQALVSAALEIAGGHIQCAIAGGMENMDRAPYLLPQGRWGARMGDVALLDSMLCDGLNDAFSHQHSGWHTEDLASRYQVSRQDQDRWALRSQQLFSRAQASGKFAAEIGAIDVPSRQGVQRFEQDEHNRPDTTAESLARLRPAFRPDGSITAGSAPGLNSGAAAMIVARQDWAQQQGVPAMGRLVSFAITAVEPGMFGMAPVSAVRQAMAKAGWSVADVGRIEINEAFAAITIANMRELDLSEDLVNPEGGAIAHGHPIGATGAVLVTRLLHAMQRDAIARGIVTLCIGGGQAIALAIESV